jgi:glutamate-1-semialdehyde 2,1-aminomutase
LITACREVGLSLGATNVHEQVYASLLCRRFRLGHIRFTNSGTEANIHCLAAARRFTGRDKVVVYRGGYHGSVLAFGTGMAANNIDKHNWIVLQYNSVAETREAFAKHDDIAAVLVEGVQGSAGSIPASKEFLGTIQELCQKVSDPQFVS